MSGEVLKKRREEAGKDLRDIAHTLKIRYDYLKAIEDEEFKKLPVEVYAKGYIRDYARFLNIDPGIIIKAYLQKMSPPVTENVAAPVEVVKKKISWIKYLLFLFFPSVVVAAFIIFSYIPSPEDQKIPSPETRTPIVQPVQPVQEEMEKIQEAEKKEDTEKVPEEKAPKKIIEKPVKEHIIEISATDTTWLLVKIDDGESKDMLLKQGEFLKLSAGQGFSLKIGNAGGINLVFDGKAIGTLGEKGQVVNLNLPDRETVE